MFSTLDSESRDAWHACAPRQPINLAESPFIPPRLDAAFYIHGGIATGNTRTSNDSCREDCKAVRLDGSLTSWLRGV